MSNANKSFARHALRDRCERSKIAEEDRDPTGQNIAGLQGFQPVQRDPLQELLGDELLEHAGHHGDGLRLGEVDLRRLQLLVGLALGFQGPFQIVCERSALVLGLLGADQGLYPRDHLAGIERLGQVVVASQKRQALDQLGLVSLGRQENHRDGLPHRIRFQNANAGVPGHPGHVTVQQDDVWQPVGRRLLHELERFGAVGGLFDLEVASFRGFQNPAKADPYRAEIIDDEGPRHRLGRPWTVDAQYKVDGPVGFPRLLITNAMLSPTALGNPGPNALG